MNEAKPLGGWHQDELCEACGEGHMKHQARNATDNHDLYVCDRCGFARFYSGKPPEGKQKPPD